MAVESSGKYNLFPQRYAVIISSIICFFKSLLSRIRFVVRPPAVFKCDEFAHVCNRGNAELSPRLFKQPSKVLILYSHEVPFHVLMVGALTDYLRQSSLASEFILKIVDVDTFYDDQLRAAVFQSKEQNVDVILSIGYILSSYLIQVLGEIGGGASIVVGMRAPQALGLTNRKALNLAGIIREPDADTAFVEHLVLFGNYVSVVLLPYWPLGDGDYLPQKAARISQFLMAKGLKVLAVPVKTVDELLDLMKREIQSIKAVIFLEGCLASEALLAARDLCWKHKVLLCFTESLYAIRYGVPIVYGSDLSSFAVEAFCLMRAHKSSGLMLSDMPFVKIPNDRELVINEPYILQLGIPRSVLDVFRNLPNVRIIRKCAQE